MNLVKEDFEKIKNNPDDMVLLSIGSFYVKKSTKEEGIKEIMASKIAREVFNLICPSYYLVEIDKNYYLISEDLNKLGVFKTGYELGITEENTSLYEIWFFLEEKYRNNPQFRKCMYELVKTYIFDIFFKVSDRHEFNWGLIFNDSEIRFAILDNSMAFDNYLNNLSSYEDSKFWARLYERGVHNVKGIEREEFFNFLRNSSQEYIAIFQSIYDIMTVDNFKRLLESSVNESLIYKEDGNIPLTFPPFEEDLLLRHYRENYAFITDTYKEYLKGRKI